VFSETGSRSGATITSSVTTVNNFDVTYGIVTSVGSSNVVTYATSSYTQVLNPIPSSGGFQWYTNYFNAWTAGGDYTAGTTPLTIAYMATENIQGAATDKVHVFSIPDAQTMSAVAGATPIPATYTVVTDLAKNIVNPYTRTAGRIDTDSSNVVYPLSVTQLTY
jgi:hypothetical protein